MLDGAYTFRKDTGDICGRVLSNNIAQDILHQGRRQGAKDYSLATLRYVVLKDYDVCNARSFVFLSFILTVRKVLAQKGRDNDLSTHRNRHKGKTFICFTRTVAHHCNHWQGNSEIALGDDPQRSRLRSDEPDLEFAERLAKQQPRQVHFTLHDTICARNSVRARERNKAACPKSRQLIMTLGAKSKERKSKLGTPSSLSTALRDNIKPIDESQDLGDYEEPQKLSKYSLV
ncbi:uncharacterized protein ARMOST_16590 [Armillaria ostoyae]|uniref:Uncharacterized protein n=1 Tax=Armillaria ostoyae TaxID=47428 RepID=A0A284RWN5_ARMOS|nr:uncharacterized protein ARMOST_16590 [Armillaria ostoyae]